LARENSDEVTINGGPMSLYKHIRNVWKNPKKNLGELWKQRLIKWRRENATTRIERPTRLDRARSLGYKAKPGFVIVRQRVLRGGHSRPTIRAGRRPKHFHQYLALRKSYQQIAEERVNRQFPNLAVLNSYLIAKDGKHAWHEVILVDPSHPHLVFATIAGAVLAGVEGNYELGEPVDKNLYGLDADQLRELKVERLPESPKEAVAAAQEGGLMKRVLGEVAFRWHVDQRMNDYRDNARLVHPTEFQVGIQRY